MAMIRIPHILASVYGQPWAIAPHYLGQIKATVDRYATTRVEEPVIINEEPVEQVTTSVQGSTGLILVSGIIGSHLSSLETMCGGYDLDQLNHDLDQMEADARVKNILMVMRTPGGTITGVPEVANRINNFQKPVVAFTDSMSASAGYWIASQAVEVWVSPSAEVGSIGVYVAMVDESAAWAKDGLKLELMKAGKHKAAGIRGLPLSQEDRDLIQADVDYWYDQFTKSVTANRSGVTEAMMQGQMFNAEDAVKNRLADRVVSSISEALKILG